MTRYVAELGLWRCPGCKQDLPVEKFQLYHNSKTGRLAIHSCCKLCESRRRQGKPQYKKPLRRLTRAQLDASAVFFSRRYR